MYPRNYFSNAPTLFIPPSQHHHQLLASSSAASHTIRYIPPSKPIMPSSNNQRSAVSNTISTPEPQIQTAPWTAPSGYSSGPQSRKRTHDDQDTVDDDLPTGSVDLADKNQHHIYNARTAATSPVGGDVGTYNMASIDALSGGPSGDQGSTNEHLGSRLAHSLTDDSVPTVIKEPAPGMGLDLTRNVRQRFAGPPSSHCGSVYSPTRASSGVEASQVDDITLKLGIGWSSMGSNPNAQTRARVEAPQVDDITLKLGIGWSSMGSNPKAQTRARALKLIIKKLFFLQASETIAEHENRDWQLAKANGVYYLFEDGARRAYRVSNDWEDTIKRLQEEPINPMIKEPIYRSEKSHSMGTQPLLPVEDPGTYHFDATMSDVGTNSSHSMGMEPLFPVEDPGTYHCDATVMDMQPLFPAEASGAVHIRDPFSDLDPGPPLDAAGEMDMGE